MNKKYDVVQKAKHYNTHPSGIELKKVALYYPSALASAMKYTYRFDQKDTELQNLEKCLWHLKEFMKQGGSYIEKSLDLADDYITPHLMGKIIRDDDVPWRSEFFSELSRARHRHGKLVHIQNAIFIIQEQIEKRK